MVNAKDTSPQHPISRKSDSTTATLAPPLVLVSGSKGGVGKSMVSLALTDHLLERNKPCRLLDSDTSNPDVSKIYAGLVPSSNPLLEEPEGWMDLLNECEQFPESAIVVNMAARSNRAVAAHAGLLQQALTAKELGRQLVVLWIINRQRDSLQLLHEFLQTLSEATVHVVRNGYFGDERQFELYNGSRIRETIEARGGKSLTFPNLPDRLSDRIYSERLTITAALENLPLGDRSALFQWRASAARLFEEIGL